MAYTEVSFSLELQTRPRFCPVSLSLSMALPKILDRTENKLAEANALTYFLVRLIFAAKARVTFLCPIIKRLSALQRSVDVQNMLAIDKHSR